MSPLANPRHEAFAFALAFGSTPAEAYLEAGFNPKNRKARAQPLADDPIIVNRVNELLAEEGVGDPAFARHRNAHPFTIIPQSADELAQYVWQIIKGSRHVTSIQWQAIRFLGRLKRWDRSGRHERGPDSGLSAINRESLAILDAAQIARDTQLHRTTAAKNDSDDDAANGGDECDQSEFEPVALFDPDAPIYPHDPVVLTREERDALADAKIAAELAAAALLNPQDTATSDQETEPAISPSEIHICGSNVDLNPHAQNDDNQPLNPENPQMWIKKEKSREAFKALAKNGTFSSSDPTTTSSEKPLPLPTSAAKNSTTPDHVPAPDASSPEKPLRPLPLCVSAAKNPNTPDALPALVPAPTPAPVPAINHQLPTINSSSPLPPNAAALCPSTFKPEDIQWLATALGKDAPAWVRARHPATAASPRQSPIPLPPWPPEEYHLVELEWLALVIGEDAPDWVRSNHPARKTNPKGGVDGL